MQKLNKLKNFQNTPFVQKASLILLRKSQWLNYKTGNPDQIFDKQNNSTQDQYKTIVMKEKLQTIEEVFFDRTNSQTQSTLVLTDNPQKSILNYFEQQQQQLAAQIKEPRKDYLDEKVRSVQEFMYLYDQSKMSNTHKIGEEQKSFHLKLQKIKLLEMSQHDDFVQNNKYNQSQNPSMFKAKANMNKTKSFLNLENLNSKSQVTPSQVLLKISRPQTAKTHISCIQVQSQFSLVNNNNQIKSAKSNDQGIKFTNQNNHIEELESGSETQFQKYETNLSPKYSKSIKDFSSNPSEELKLTNFMSSAKNIFQNEDYRSRKLLYEQYLTNNHLNPLYAQKLENSQIYTLIPQTAEQFQNYNQNSLPRAQSVERFKKKNNLEIIAATNYLPNPTSLQCEFHNQEFHDQEFQNFQNYAIKTQEETAIDNANQISQKQSFYQMNQYEKFTKRAADQRLITLLERKLNRIERVTRPAEEMNATSARTLSANMKNYVFEAALSQMLEQKYNEDLKEFYRQQRNIVKIQEKKEFFNFNSDKLKNIDNNDVYSQKSYQEMNFMQEEEKSLDKIKNQSSEFLAEDVEAKIQENGVSEGIQKDQYKNQQKFISPYFESNDKIVTFKEIEDILYRNILVIDQQLSFKQGDIRKTQSDKKISIFQQKCKVFFQHRSKVQQTHNIHNQCEAYQTFHESYKSEKFRILKQAKQNKSLVSNQKYIELYL